MFTKKEEKVLINLLSDAIDFHIRAKEDSSTEKDFTVLREALFYSKLNSFSAINEEWCVYDSILDTDDDLNVTGVLP